MSARAPKTRGAAQHVFTAALFLLFVTALLLALVAGVGVYRRVHAAGAAARDARLAGALVANIVRSKDATGAIRLEEAPGGGQSLVMTERLASGTFETRLYLQDGALVEEYVPAGTPYDPARATELAQTVRFEVALDVSAGALTITTDDASTRVALRSADPFETPATAAENASADESVAAPARAAGAADAADAASEGGVA
ncbi:DUF4860 domain-containing protein [Collinsella sp. An268]|uniref:DUF4860 domain-containing protein n=1 Tax=Collinsella sp. An268 TaxID=1965612 RepID=UPI000B383585|nr:DUF4860 domain-containing protein [Collinsella sp. An268]OUO63777.1 hypothetical protein B5F70_08625 [Collinsella sp. An268]